MNPDEVAGRIGKIKYMTREQAWIFYDLITANQLHIGLELGFFQGASTAYIAGAIQDTGSGSLTTIDLLSAKDRVPNVERTLEAAGLSHLVQIHYEYRSFNWRLMKLLDADAYESFDFCYIDGGHTWYDTGFAFCLVERLLKPGGWVAFDDLYYTHRESNNAARSWVQRLPEEEQVTAQVEKVFDLLVEEDPHFDTFRRQGRFAFARKRCSVWSRDQRARNNEEHIISSALERARADPEFREGLLRLPSAALASISGLPPEDFRHLRFANSGRFGPVPSEQTEAGEMIVYVERPRWDSPVTESALQKMLEE
jgi:predicted O-methyltransferase YrrM